MSFRSSLLERAAGRRARIVLCEGDDPRVQAAAERLRILGIAELVLLSKDGMPGGHGIVPAADPRLPDIAAYLRERRPDRIHDGVHALDVAAEPVNFGAALVALGHADGCVAGAVYSTRDVLRAALWAIGPAPGISLVSSAFYMVTPDDRVFTFTDCAVVVEPSAAQLAEIAVAASRVRPLVVGDLPRVAFLSFSTKGSGASPSVDKVRDATAAFRALVPNIAADGELQGDAALDAAVAARKASGSSLGGMANVLVFPNLDAGNIAYKLVQRLGQVVALGPVLQGLARPMSDLSRGATADDIVEITAMIALQCDTSPTS